ncbi:membrane protease subunit stomatin/prohibitin-like protein [Candidatus Magnetomorum sp. HK-1]|nr:membrane protease subunit stomatin/prohibitin-like protein [Candidatus Magnetomorum sp. HK-1]
MSKKNYILSKIKFFFPTLIVFCVVTLFLIGIFINNILHVIYPGQAGIRWSFFHGTEVDYIYPEGFHLILPCDKMYIYDIRIQEISKELDVLSKTGLKVKLILSIRFRPKHKFLGLLHQNIGQDYPNKIILPEIESVMREIIGTLDSDQIYTTGRKVIAEAIDQAIEQLYQRYIQVDDVLIRKIILPDIVAEAIKFKIEQKHLVEAHEFIIKKEIKEADRKYIEAVGMKRRNLIVLESLKDKKLLQWEGIIATKELAKSENAKIVIIGDKDGLPIIFNSSK